MEKPNPNKKAQVEVSDKWMKKLLQFDFNSKGKNINSLTITRKF